MNKKEISLYDKWLDYLELVHQKTGIKGKYVIVGLIASIIFVSVGFLDRFITNLVGTIYPAYWTMKSIETNTDDDRHWLTYWVVFASFTIIDIFSGFLLKYIPFYFFIKIVFLIWLFMPNSKGCIIIYNLVVFRLFKSVEQDIDQAGNKINEYTKELISITSENIEKQKNEIFEKVVDSKIQNIVKNNVPKDKKLEQLDKKKDSKNKK
jgi:receptor expression-enhancing protein 5/6